MAEFAYDMAKCPSPIYVLRNKDSPSWERRAVPCGRKDCAICCENRRNEWLIRLIEEKKGHEFAYFITLSYSDERLVYGNNDNATLYKPHLQGFIKALRNRNKKVRFYALGEYGPSTLRPHYHVCLYCATPLGNDFLESIWEKGFITKSLLTESRMKYTLKYHLNRLDNPPGTEESFVLMSTNPGLGLDYVKRMGKFHSKSIERDVYTSNGIKSKLPRYFREKMYSRGERATIAFNKEMENIEFSPGEIQNYLANFPGSSEQDYFKSRFYYYENLKKRYKEKANQNKTL